MNDFLTALIGRRGQTWRNLLYEDGALIRLGMRLALIVLIFLVGTGTTLLARSDEVASVWFSPDSETPDLLDLFKNPEAWGKTRTRLNVFKFGPRQVSTSSSSNLNTLSNLVQADAFRKLKQWGIAVAIEAPAVKEWDCTSKRAAKIAFEYIQNVRMAGGEVSYVAMDEPLVSGLRSCQLTLEEAAARTANYVRDVLKDASISPVDRKVGFGDIEPYPSYSVDQLKQWISALQMNGFEPSFFHLDVDLNNVDLHPKIDLADDLRALKIFLQHEGIPFGIIFWSGRDPENSDEDYYNRVLDYVRKVHVAVGRPEQSIFQSWVLRVSRSCSAGLSCGIKNTRCSPLDPAYCGSRSVPVNLPESSMQVFSHTRLINESLRILGGP